MERKIATTGKITITTPKTLYDAVIEYIKRTQKFSNVADFSAFAMRYFALRFHEDISPYIAIEFNKRKENNTQFERIEFDSEYSGTNISWQPTIPVGAALAFSAFRHSYPTLDDTSMIRYSVEYCLNCMKYADLIQSEILNNVPLSIDKKPQIKIKPVRDKTKKQDEPPKKDN